MKPKFEHRLNKAHKIKGKEIWESRSTALGAVVLAIHKDNIFVLIEKRSMKMPDGPGQWAVPSGYIDYDENAWKGITREIYEETSFYLDKYKGNLVFNNTEQPFYVHTDPSENRQNILLWYCMIYDFSDGDLPRDIEKYKDVEVDEVKWIPIEQVFSGKYDWAFNHETRVEMAINKFEKYLV